jgi:hypothetical protein
MRGETLTSIDRVECALNREKPDRVPIWPDVTTSSAAALTEKKFWETGKGAVKSMPRLLTEAGFENGSWRWKNIAEGRVSIPRYSRPSACRSRISLSYPLQPS